MCQYDCKLQLFVAFYIIVLFVFNSILIWFVKHHFIPKKKKFKVL